MRGGGVNDACLVRIQYTVFLVVLPVDLHEVGAEIFNDGVVSVGSVPVGWDTVCSRIVQR